MKKSRIWIAGLAAIAAAAAIGGTWAAWTQTLLAKNEFMTAKYSTFLEEQFKKPDGWLPGEEVKKAVWVKNESTIPIIAQVSMNQGWVRREDVTAWLPDAGNGGVTETLVGRQGEQLPLTFDGENGEEFAAILNFNAASDPADSQVVVLKDSRIEKTGLQLGIPAVDTIEEANGKWLLVSEDPKETGNYTFYYLGLVQPGESTPYLLTSVTMNPQLETTVTGHHTYFEEDPEHAGEYRQITVDTVNSKYGYDSSHYDLNLSMKTVQATKDAVDTMYPSDSVTQYISGYLAGSGVYESASQNTLAFDRINGQMVYYPIDQISADGREGGNWFMSFTNMVPGGTYLDRLSIENRSGKAYDLFMQIKPRAQETVKDELLKQISMEVYYGDSESETLLYQGDATGYYYADENGTDMQNLVYLGYYGSGEEKQIRVVLKLNPELGLQEDGSYRYADVLTKIDWEFYVTENHGGGHGGGSSGGGSGGSGGSPRSGRHLYSIDDDPVPLMNLEDELVPLAALPATGDTLPVLPVAVTAVVSLLLMLLFAKLSKGKKGME